MAWGTGLSPEQQRAASHVGSHARLLAGPGTGKTLTLSRRVAYLTTAEELPPEQILLLTFTRAAASEFRRQVDTHLETQGNGPPRISTLHAFALRQLLRNTSLVTGVPRPVRIADDWEERNIIEPDLKQILNLGRIYDVRERFNRLSSDWETLAAEEPEWEANYGDPEFLGAWREHQRVYGYTLRSQLVYQLKKSIEQLPGFQLEAPFRHIIVDEYQDLNRCDIAVVKAISARGSEVFVAGDDDQSIYGFRYAHPDGIRNFGQEYSPWEPLELEECRRCDREILRLGLFVARLDPRREPKLLKPGSDAGKGEVHLLWATDQYEEANVVARACKLIIEAQGVAPGKILILLRSNRYGAFSKVIQSAFSALGVPLSCRTDTDTPLDTDKGREFLTILRLCVNQGDHLAWRTLLQLRHNSIGEKGIAKLYDSAHASGKTFVDILNGVAGHPESLTEGGLGQKVQKEVSSIRGIVGDVSSEEVENAKPMDIVTRVAKKVISVDKQRSDMVAYLEGIAESSNAASISDLLSSLSASLGENEQEIDQTKVNLLTMHKAKGLTADVVFLVAAEDEYIPGNAVGAENEGNERRLLYVSLTRARRILFITHCKRRTGQQRHTGRTSGTLARNLTRFLKDAPLTSESGLEYIARHGA